MSGFLRLKFAGLCTYDNSMAAIFASTKNRCRRFSSPTFILSFLLGSYILFVFLCEWGQGSGLQQFYGRRIPFINHNSCVRRAQNHAFSPRACKNAKLKAQVFQRFSFRITIRKEGFTRTVTLGTFSKHHILVSLVFLAGDIELNPGPKAGQEREKTKMAVWYM